MPKETNKPQLSYQHYSILIVIIILGSILRFANLDLKDLGIDEILTAIFGLGKSYQNIPKEIVFTPADLRNIFTLNSQTTCAEIANTLVKESTHPPLFFCAIHQWLKWLDFLDLDMVWKLRSLPAIFGIGSIALVYYLNRIAFSPIAGLMGTAIIAFSPFGVYLSQEARHYTLPILLITVSLICLIKIQRSLKLNKSETIYFWLIWIITNSVSFYVHYFCLLAYAAQAIVLGGLIYRAKNRKKLLNLPLPLIFFLPWFPILIEHFTNPKTGWLPAPEHIIPLLQTWMAWLLIAIALPLENQPRSIQIFMGILTILFAIWLVTEVWQGLKKMWNDKITHQNTVILSSFIALVLLQFLGIIYLLGKDITVAPRYHFIYYPAFCSLLGASLVTLLRVKEQGRRKREENQSLEFNLNFFQALFIVNNKPDTKANKTPKKILPDSIIITVIAGFISSILVIYNIVLEKPYLPNLTAEIFARSSKPIMVVTGYENSNEIALGISYALALDRIRSDREQTYFAFFDRRPSYNLLWQRLANLNSPTVVNLWIVAPGLRQREYPQKLQIGNNKNCTIDPDNYYRVGIPYQLYLCE